MSVLDDKTSPSSTVSYTTSSTIEYSICAIRNLLLKGEEYFEAVSNNHKRSLVSFFKSFDFPVRKTSETKVEPNRIEWQFSHLCRSLV